MRILVSVEVVQSTKTFRTLIAHMRSVLFVHRPHVRVQMRLLSKPLRALPARPIALQFVRRREMTFESVLPVELLAARSTLVFLVRPGVLRGNVHI